MSTDNDTDGSGESNTGDGSTGGDSGPGTREVAYRLFATEFEDSELSYSESDEERAPNYVVTPTGLRVNRLFAVGVLTEIERINTDTLRGRIVDPTGAFVTYAGQYQPEAQAFLDGADSPSFVAITGKARTFEPEDSDRIFTSVRPESLSEVTADTRDRWTVSAAEATLERIAVTAEALDSGLQGDDLRVALEAAGVNRSLAAGIPRALDYYGTTPAYLEAIRQCAVDALEVVADERDEVRPVEVDPDEGGAATLGQLPAVDIDLSDDASASTPTPEPSAASADAPTEPADPSDTTASTTTESDESTESPDTAATTNTEADTADASDTTEAATEPAATSTATEAAAESTTADATNEPTAADATGESTTTDTATGSPEADPSTATADAESTTAEPENSLSAAADSDTDTTTGGETADDTAEDPELYELDEDRAEELESEFGADFSSGNEVDPAGEADIDVPDADELAAEVEGDSEPSDGSGAAASESTTTASTTAESTTESTTTASEASESSDNTETLGSFEDTIDDSDESSAGTEAETDEPATDESTASDDAAGADAEDIDLEDAAVELMGNLDDGDGADRETVVKQVAADHGVDSAAVEDAIDDALMGGRCYEPDDGILKPI